MYIYPLSHKGIIITFQNALLKWNACSILRKISMIIITGNPSSVYKISSPFLLVAFMHVYKGISVFSYEYVQPVAFYMIWLLHTYWYMNYFLKVWLMGCTTCFICIVLSFSMDVVSTLSYQAKTPLKFGYGRVSVFLWMWLLMQG